MSDKPVINHFAMARIKSSHKTTPVYRRSSGTPYTLVRFDTWRRVDLGLVVASIGFWMSGRFTFIPLVFILLTVIEILFEMAIHRSNREWENTLEGGQWVRRMIWASRLFFIPTKMMIFLIALFLLIMRW
jgi:hypothetical protein